MNLKSGSGKSALVVLALLLALGGCGRKSGLDLPPQASVQQPAGAQQPVQVQPDGTPVLRRNSLGLFDPEEEEKPVVNSRPQRRIFLDRLLD